MALPSHGEHFVEVSQSHDEIEIGRRCASGLKLQNVAGVVLFLSEQVQQGVICADDLERKLIAGGATVQRRSSGKQ